MTASVKKSNSGTSADALFAERVEELTAKFQAGEPFDVEAYLARCPELADRLRPLLPALQMFGALSEAGADGLSFPLGEQDQGAGTGTLGDFRIVREVGRGGMAVVYEAEQVSLGRRVALKVLPLASTMDPRRLQRFHNEARAAACLHHTNIVPVFAVGSERGVHYYAMQFIDGQPLSDVIRQLRQAKEKPNGYVAAQEEVAPEEVRTTVYAAPAGAITASPTVRAGGDATQLTGPQPGGRDYYRKVAELGVQAAEALDHAHQVGIVHRDVKPGNLLLDGSGRLWVTDFGLAQMRQGDAGLTLTGEMVGTLRYMSPEQALAKRVVIDHRTDVYSLGATLYEMLTLRPVFAGGDRQELLRQIAFEEPVALRKLDRTIPAELETIVLKAMEKNPPDRYSTAQDLADDLQHWLDDRAIKARRPSLRQVAAKWVRRHRPVVWAAAVLFLVLAVVGGANGLWWVQKRSAAQAEARGELREASRLQQEEKWPEALGAVRRARVALAGVWADRGLRQEIEDLGNNLKMVHLLQEARLRGAAVKDEGFDTKATIQAYADAFDWYGLDVDHLEAQEAAQRIRTCSIAVHLVAALDDWASLLQMWKASGWKHRVAVCRAADPDPWRNRLRDALESKDPEALQHLAASARADELPPATAVLLARLAHGTPANERAVIILRQAQQRHYADFWVNFELGSSLAQLEPPQIEEAIRYLSVAAVLRPQSAFAHQHLGNALHAKGKVDEVIACFQRVIAIDPKNAWAHDNLGYALHTKGKVDEAIACLRKAIALDPKLARAHNNLGASLCDDKRDYEAAIASFNRAIAIDPKLADAHGNLGNALHAKGKEDEAIACYHKAIALDPKDANFHHNLGNALHAKGKEDEAIACYHKAIALDPKDANFHHNLGNALHAKGKVDEAIACYHKAIALDPKFARAHSNLGAILYNDKRDYEAAIASFNRAIVIDPKLADAHGNLGVALWAKGKEDEAIACYHKAIALNPRHVKSHFNLGNALHAKRKEDEAIACYHKAIALDPKYANAHGALGLALIEKGEFIEAQKALRQCLALLPPSHPERGLTSQLLRQCQQLLDADGKLKAFLAGKGAPTDPAAQAQMADLAQKPYKRLNLAAAQLYRDAFARQPPLADAHRYNAACAAALAGCGQGKDAVGISDKERTRLRQQAIDWLRADLAAWGRILHKEPDTVRPPLRQQMKHWQQDTDLAGVRGDALTKLPELERRGWQEFWGDVSAMLARAEERTTPTTKPPVK